MISFLNLFKYYEDSKNGKMNLLSALFTLKSVKFEI